MDWEAEARHILKGEIARSGLTYGRLAKRLQSLQVKETERSIASKMSRGTFSFAFFLQCLKAMEMEDVTIRLREGHRQTRPPSASQASESNGEPRGKT